MIMHGPGTGGEYRSIVHLCDWDTIGHDGVIGGNMTLCVESCTGALGGNEGFNPEEPVVVTERGCRTLSRSPCEEPRRWAVPAPEPWRGRRD